MINTGGAHDATKSWHIEVDSGDIISEDAAKGRLIISNVKLIYSKDSYTSEIVTSYCIDVPDFNWAVNEYQGTIDPAVETPAEKINFEGNNLVSGKTLKSKFTQKEKGVFNKGAFLEANEELDRQAILNYYHSRGYIDATVIAQKPKLRPYIDQMEENIAKVLRIERDQINVKATTEEGMGFTGEGRGISAQAICLVESPTNLFNQRVDGRSCEGCSGCAK